MSRFVLSILVVSLAACGQVEAPAAPLTTVQSFCSTAMKPVMEKGLSKGQRATLQGYLQPPRMFTLCSDTCMFSLSEEASGGGRSVSISLKVGDGKNQLRALPQKFQRSDVKLTTRDGKTVDLGRPIRVSGERGGEDEKSCYQSVDRVEQ